jgi:hypothetical protein
MEIIQEAKNMVPLFYILIIGVAASTALAMMWFVLHEPDRPEPHTTSPYVESGEMPPPEDNQASDPSHTGGEIGE